MEIVLYFKKKYHNSVKIIWIFNKEGGFPSKVITGNKCRINIIDHPQ